MRVPRRAVLQALVFIGLSALLPLLITRRLGWWEAWVYALVCLVGFLASRLLVARRYPDLIAERAGSMRREDAASAVAGRAVTR